MKSFSELMKWRMQRPSDSQRLPAMEEIKRRLPLYPSNWFWLYIRF